MIKVISTTYVCPFQLIILVFYVADNQQKVFSLLIGITCTLLAIWFTITELIRNNAINLEFREEKDLSKTVFKNRFWNEPSVEIYFYYR